MCLIVLYNATVKRKDRNIMQKVLKNVLKKIIKIIIQAEEEIIVVFGGLIYFVVAGISIYRVCNSNDFLYASLFGPVIFCILGLIFTIFPLVGVKHGRNKVKNLKRAGNSKGYGYKSSRKNLANNCETRRRPAA